MVELHVFEQSHMTIEGGSAVDELILVRKIEKFLICEVGLLDDRQFDDWINLFTEDGYYWAPASIDQRTPDAEVSLFFDDVPMMRTRFARLRHPRVHSQIPPSRTSHMLSNVSVSKKHGSKLYSAEARFQMLEFRLGYDQRTFGGKYEYDLVLGPDDGIRIAAKKATILNCDDIHLPIAVPF